MKSQEKLNRELARVNGIDTRLVSVRAKQKGYGRQGVFLKFNKFQFGNIDDLYICDVFPNIHEHFDNYDETNELILSDEELIIERFSDEIYNYLESIEDEEEGTD
jgi:hypothetical protein